MSEMAWLHQQSMLHFDYFQARVVREAVESGSDLYAGRVSDFQIGLRAGTMRFRTSLQAQERFFEIPARKVGDGHRKASRDAEK